MSHPPPHLGHDPFTETLQFRAQYCLWPGGGAQGGSISSLPDSANGYFEAHVAHHKPLRSLRPLNVS